MLRNAGRAHLRRLDVEDEKKNSRQPNTYTDSQFYETQTPTSTTDEETNARTHTHTQAGARKANESANTHAAQIERML